MFDEVVTTALARTGRVDVAVRAGKMILGSPEESLSGLASLVRVEERVFAEAWALFKSGRFRGLSFTDHTILALMKERGIDTLVSFDTGFDGKVQRIG